MYVIIGYTPKGEAFVVGHTTSAKKAQAFIDRYDTANGEYVEVEAQYSRNI